jgi:hypothetical protein
MEAVGFDYDYTLASYTDNLQPLIYDLAVRYLVNNMGYPHELETLKYDPNFPVRYDYLLYSALYVTNKMLGIGRLINVLLQRVVLRQCERKSFEVGLFVQHHSWIRLLRAKSAHVSANHRSVLWAPRALYISLIWRDSRSLTGGADKSLLSGKSQAACGPVLLTRGMPNRRLN